MVQRPADQDVWRARQHDHPSSTAARGGGGRRHYHQQELLLRLQSSKGKGVPVQAQLLQRGGGRRVVGHAAARLRRLRPFTLIIPGR